MYTEKITNPDTFSIPKHLKLVTGVVKITSNPGLLTTK